MKEIKLTQGKVAIVDDDDFERLSKYRWSTTYHGYAQAHIKLNVKHYTKITMHRLIMNAAVGQYVDHINGNPLDNRKSNLRFCTLSQNQGNRRKNYNNISGYKGVTFYSKTQKWCAKITLNKKTKNLGYFGTAEEAARAYDSAAIQAFGKFAYLNFSQKDVA